MEYHEIFPLERAELERLLTSGNSRAIVDALLSAAYYDLDWRWVQDICLRFLDHPENDVRWNATICLGHLARIHGRLDTETVLPRLMALKTDSAVSSAVEDTLEDIKSFLRLQ